MNNGGDNESDHSPLILDGSFRTVQEGDDNERLPWEFSEGDEDGDDDNGDKLEGTVSSASRSVDRRMISPPETLTKALSTLTATGIAGTPVLTVSNQPVPGGYRRASSIRVKATHPALNMHHVTATIADIRFAPKSPLSTTTENESLTTSATVTPPDAKSLDYFRSEMRSPPGVHRRKPSISTLSGYQEFSAPPPWHELTKLDDLNAPVRLVSEQEFNWSAICSSLQDVRRLVLHHPDAVGVIVRKESSMLLVLIPRILELIDNPRSLVAKNAITTLHDIFLFTPTHVPGNLVFDCLHCVLRRCTCSSFIGEEAMRCMKQIIITADTLRVLHTLMTVLTKQGRNYATLRYVAIYASGLFLLRLKAQSLQAVIQHRDFVSSFLKPIVKATNDASQDCRCAAAECCIILTNLWPDLKFRFKNLGSECDLGAALVRAKRLYKPIAEVYSMNVVAESYARCPDNATIELAFDRLQTILANIEEISRQPLDAESPYVGSQPMSRSVTPSTKNRLSPGGRVVGGTMSTRRPNYRSPPAVGVFADRELDTTTRGLLNTHPVERLTTPPERMYKLTGSTPIPPGERASMAEFASPSSSHHHHSRMTDYYRSPAVLPGVAEAPEGGVVPRIRGSHQSRLSLDYDGRKSLLQSPAPLSTVRRPTAEDFDESHLPAYATRGNLRYAPSATRGQPQCTVVDEPHRRTRRGL